MLTQAHSHRGMSYLVKFIADDLGVALVVVPAGNGELQRPEQTVIDLQTDIITGSSLSAQLINISSLTSVCKHAPPGSPVRRSRGPSPLGNHSCRTP